MSIFLSRSKPAFERLGLGAGDGLDQAENALRVPALELLPPARRLKRQRKGGGSICPPPLAVQAQIRVAPAHLLPVVRRVGSIRQGGDDVSNDKPPFVVVQGAADFAALEQRHAGLRIVVGLTHHCIQSLCRLPHYAKLAWP